MTGALYKRTSGFLTNYRTQKFGKRPPKKFFTYIPGTLAQWSESWNSKPTTPGSIPRQAGWGTVFLSLPPSQLLCRLVCAWPPFVCAARTQICAHVNDPISICRKRVGLTAGGMETRKHCTQKKKKRWVAPWLLAFPGENSANFPCMALGQEHYLVYCYYRLRILNFGQLGSAHVKRLGFPPSVAKGEIYRFNQI